MPFLRGRIRPATRIEIRPGPIYLNEKKLKMNFTLALLLQVLLRNKRRLLRLERTTQSKECALRAQLLALTACSRLKRTQPLNQHFFFFVVVFFLFVLFAPPPLPGIFSLEKSYISRARGATATWPRGLVRWQVPPERHMRIVFTCCSLSRSQFCCNL